MTMRKRDGNCWLKCVSMFAILSIVSTNIALVMGQVSLSHHLRGDTELPKQHTTISVYLTTMSNQLPKNYSEDKVVFYKWNKTQISPLDYQQSYCPMRCKGDNVVYINNLMQMKCPTLYCAPCSCHRPSCEIYDVCCPDIYESYLPPPGLTSGIFSLSDLNPNKTLVDQPETIEGFFNVGNVTRKYFNSKRPRLDCESVFTTTNFLYIRSCAEDYQGDVVKLCEEDVSPEEITLDMITRVVDTDTQVVYRNKFCAQCNKVTQPKSAIVDIKCYNYMAVYKATSPDELLKMTYVDAHENCKVLQKFDQPLPTVKCYPNQFSTSPENECTWTETYDADVRAACQELRANHLTVFTKHPYLFFTNIFCAICRLSSDPQYGICRGFGGNVEEPKAAPDPPLTLLLNFRQSPTTDTDTKQFNHASCREGYWTSSDCECRELHCIPGKSLENGTCTTVMPDVSGLGYRLKIWLVSDVDNMTYSLNISVQGLISNFTFKLEEMLSSVSNVWKLSLGTIVRQDSDNHADNYTDNHNDNHTDSHIDNHTDNHIDNQTDPITDHSIDLNYPIVLWVDATILSKTEVLRDEIENTIVQKFINNSIQLEIGQDRHLTFRPVVMVSEPERNKSCKDWAQVNNYWCSEERILSRTFKTNVHEHTLKYLKFFINISNLLWCSYVSFNKTSYTIEVDETRAPPKINIELDLVGTRITFSEFSELNMLALDGDGVLNVCRQLLDTKLGQMDGFDRLKNVGRNYFWSADYILTLVVMSVSMTCLLATLLTYSLFPVLRSRAGKRNMFLSGSLLLAHASLLATSHISGPSWLCTAVGVSTHFLWLWMFTWTFICSFQMFRVFTMINIQHYTLNQRDQTFELIRQIVSSLILPLVVVVTVVVTSLINTQGRTTGYGDVVCYLNSPFLIGVSVVAPLMLIVVCNLTFFIITVVKIHRVALLQSNDRREDRKNLFVYAKLSSMTGAFWVLGIIDGAVDVSVLRYISIVLNGLQGVFIFTSFVCSKKIYSLYVSLVGLDHQPSPPPTETPQSP